MRSLQLLDLRKSSLSGTIPSFFKNLTRLELLNVGGNCITGNVATSVCALPPSISLVNAPSNSLSGTLPPCLGKMSELKYLNFDENVLTGSIPPYISTFNRLTELRLGKQSLTGTLPKLSDLANLNLVNLPQNQLSGTIPSTYLPLTLQTLVLYGNLLTGGIDPVRNVKVKVELDNNQLTGTVSGVWWSRRDRFDARELYLGTLRLLLPVSRCLPTFQREPSMSARTNLLALCPTRSAFPSPQVTKPPIPVRVVCVLSRQILSTLLVHLTIFSRVRFTVETVCIVACARLRSGFSGHCLLLRRHCILHRRQVLF